MGKGMMAEGMQLQRLEMGTHLGFLGGQSGWSTVGG